jgi:signal transduction histidine kinase/HPt (histidine-containing phosphotransfer) domain-containing protein
MKFRDALKNDYKQLICVCASFLTIATLSYFSVSSVTKRLVNLHSHSEVNTYRAIMRSMILSHEAALRNLAVFADITLDNGGGREELREILNKWKAAYGKQSELNGDIIAAYGYLNGSYIDEIGENQDESFFAAITPLISGAIMRNGIFHSTPRTDGKTGNPVSSVATVISDSEGRNTGVLALDFLLTPLLEEVKTYKLAEGGYGILLDNSFTIIASPTPEYVGKRLNELPQYERAFEKIQKLDDNVLVETVYSDSGKKIGFFSRLENGWYLGIISPVWYYYKGVNEIFTVIAVLSAVLALVLCAILIRLNAAKMRSEEESRSKTSFLARMSHEIRTPMNAIIGMSELAMKDWGTQRGLGHVTAIKRAGGDLVAIINDILDFSKVAADKLRITDAPYETYPLFNEIMAIIGVRAAQKSLGLSAEIAPDIPKKLIGDKIRVRQILLNLLANAVKYTNQGHIALSVATAPSGGDGVQLIFTIRDTGIGIKPEHHENIFGDFVSLYQDGEKHIEGTGLGLPISRSLCLSMGGDISVESEYGKGSAFTATIIQGVADRTPAGAFDFRACDKKNAPAEEHASFSAPRCQVLVVDDLPMNLEVMSGLLSFYEIEAVTSLRGRDAVELAKGREFDMIFVDHMMPEMDGIETVKALRQINDRLKRVPIIAFTANAIFGMKDMFLSKGFDDYISKPVGIAKLDELMDRWVPPELRAAGRRGAILSAPSVNEIEGVDIRLGLGRMGGSVEAYKKALGTFCRDVESCLSGLNEGDIAALTLNAHSLKGISAQIGALKLSEEAAFLEQAGKTRDLQTIRENLESLRDGFMGLTSRIRDAMPEHRASDGTSDGLPDDAEPPASDLLKLREVIYARSIGEIDRILDDLSGRRLKRGVREGLSLISDYLLVSEFGEAEGVIDNMLKEAGL